MNPVDSRLQLGRRGEHLAAAYIAEQGYTIIERNWRCMAGEIDLIAAYEGKIIFIEVRTRRATGTFGAAAESVQYRKQQKVRSLARYYLHHRRLHDSFIRFDVIAIELDLDGKYRRLTHIRHAF